MNLKKFIPVLLLILSAFLFQASGAYAISWRDDLESALKDGKAAKKPVMVDFYATWCGPCKKLADETFTNSELNRLAAEFICVKVDGDRNAQLLMKYGVRAYPTVLFFDGNGNIEQQIVGFQTADAFIPLMRGILERTKKSQPPSKKGGVLADEKLESLRKSERQVKPEEKKSLFNLSGIIYDPKNPRAIINNTIVKKGDIINDAEVVEIAENTVKLHYKDSEVILEID